MNLKARIDHYQTEIKKLESELLFCKRCLNELIQLEKGPVASVGTNEEIAKQAAKLINNTFSDERKLAIARIMVDNHKLGRIEVAKILRSTFFDGEALMGNTTDSTQFAAFKRAFPFILRKLQGT